MGKRYWKNKKKGRVTEIESNKEFPVDFQSEVMEGSSEDINIQEELGNIATEDLLSSYLGDKAQDIPEDQKESLREEITQQAQEVFSGDKECSSEELSVWNQVFSLMGFTVKVESVKEDVEAKPVEEQNSSSWFSSLIGSVFSTQPKELTEEEKQQIAINIDTSLKEKAQSYQELINEKDGLTSRAKNLINYNGLGNNEGSKKNISGNITTDNAFSFYLKQLFLQELDHKDFNSDEFNEAIKILKELEKQQMKKDIVNRNNYGAQTTLTTLFNKQSFKTSKLVTSSRITASDDQVNREQQWKDNKSSVEKLKLN